jgi:hypothetical protein
LLAAYIVAVTCFLVSHATPGLAQAAGPGPSGFELPPSPAKAKPQLIFEVHTGFSAPLNHDALCPSDAGCVMENGGGVGSSVERRWPGGLGVIGGYDLWFLDTDSVYELGVQQLFRGGLRYSLPTNYIFHPMFEFGAGFMVYGDTFQAATAGILLQPVVGVEAELTESVGLRFGLGVRVFSHRAFRTQRDGVLRGVSGPFSESLYVELGLTFL